MSALPIETEPGPDLIAEAAARFLSEEWPLAEETREALAELLRN